jgi:AcrR family transcriptional regulator
MRRAAAGEGSKDALRQDAQMRRERLVQAAVELFGSDGFDVPLEKIADRAEVGRATLYRNFPDRAALAAAVQEARLAELAAQVAEWGDRDDAFYLAVQALASLVVAASGFEKMVTMEHLAPAINERFRVGVERLLAEPLVRAKAAGLVREDFPIGDVHLAALMVAGGGLESRGRDAPGSIVQALRLLFRGLAPPGRG